MMNTGMMITGASLLGVGIHCLLLFCLPAFMFGGRRAYETAKYLSIASACAIIAGALILDLTR